MARAPFRIVAVKGPKKAKPWAKKQTTVPLRESLPKKVRLSKKTVGFLNVVSDCLANKSFRHSDFEAALKFLEEKTVRREAFTLADKLCEIATKAMPLVKEESPETRKEFAKGLINVFDVSRLLFEAAGQKQKAEAVYQLITVLSQNHLL